LATNSNAALGSSQPTAGSSAAGSKAAPPIRGDARARVGHLQQQQQQQQQPSGGPVLTQPASRSQVLAQQHVRLLPPGRGKATNRRPAPAVAPAQAGRAVAASAAKTTASVQHTAPGKAAVDGPVANSSSFSSKSSRCLIGPISASSGSTRAAAIRPGATSADAVRIPSRVGRTAQSLPLPATPLAIEAQHTLQPEVSSNSSSSLRECEAELRLELTAVLLFRLLRRWRLAAADMCVDRARARPMYNLLRYVTPALIRLCSCSDHKHAPQIVQQLLLSSDVVCVRDALLQQLDIVGSCCTLSGAVLGGQCRRTYIVHVVRCVHAISASARPCGPGSWLWQLPAAQNRESRLSLSGSSSSSTANSPAKEASSACRLQASSTGCTGSTAACCTGTHGQWGLLKQSDKSSSGDSCGSARRQ
jgi:hypothetical protein